MSRLSNTARDPLRAHEALHYDALKLNFSMAKFVFGKIILKSSVGDALFKENILRIDVVGVKEVEEGISHTKRGPITICTC